MNRFFASPGRRVGFTLVELLVVIVIIGVLAGLLLPVALRIQSSARGAECRNNLHQLYTALELYRNANDSYYPTVAMLPSMEQLNRPRMRDVLDKYAGNGRVFRCPADSKGYFEREGCSYEFNGRLGGQRVLGRGSDRMGTTRIMVFYDYEDFHGGAGVAGSRNFVFADGHTEQSEAHAAAPDNETTPTPTP